MSYFRQNRRHTVTVLCALGATLRALVALAFFIAAVGSEICGAQTLPLSAQLQVQATTIPAGTNPAIKIVVTNLTSAAYTIWPNPPVLNVQTSNGPQSYPLVASFRPGLVFTFQPNQTLYTFGTASAYWPLDRFRDYFGPGQYTIQYCGHLTVGDVCTNQVSITLQ